MTKIESMLMFAKTNNLPAIWKSKVTGNDLAAELGELSEFDRLNIEIFEKYRTGNGTVKSYNAVKALTRLAPKAEQCSASVRAEIYEHVLGIPMSAEPKTLTPLLRANTLGAQLESRKARERREILANRVASYTGERPSPSTTFDELRKMIIEIERPSRKVRRAA